MNSSNILIFFSFTCNNLNDYKFVCYIANNYLDRKYTTYPKRGVRKKKKKKHHCKTNTFFASPNSKTIRSHDKT